MDNQNVEKVKELVREELKTKNQVVLNKIAVATHKSPPSEEELEEALQQLKREGFIWLDRNRDQMSIWQTIVHRKLANNCSS